MTLIISTACRFFCAQLSDRLITEASSQSKLDSTFNKSLLYFGSDGYVSISFSGIAVINNRPTDQWVAETISGHEFPNLGITPATIQKPMKHWHSIGFAMEMLCSKLNAWLIYHPNLEPYAPELSIAGWHFTRRLWRPILWSVELNRLAMQFEVIRIPSDYWWLDNRIYTSLTPGNSGISSEQFAALRNALRASGSLKAAEQAMYSALLAVSSKISSVGSTALSILMPPPWENTVQVRFLQSDADMSSSIVEETDSTSGHQRLTRFTPWLVFPHQVRPPSVHAGMGAVFEFGELRVFLEPPSDAPLPPHPDGHIPTFDFGLLDPNMDHMTITLRYKGDPDFNQEIGNWEPQVRQQFRRPRGRV